MNGNYIQKQTRPDAIEQLQNSIVRSQFVAGEPIREVKLARPGSGFLSAILPSGMRAIAVRVSANNTAGGFILPGDRVDVVETVAQQASADGPTSNVSRTILTNVKVLAIDQSVQDKEGEAVVVGKTATLELDPAQVEIVTAAEASGTLSLSLRSIADTDEVVSAREQKPSGTVRIFRGGRSQIADHQMKSPEFRSKQMTVLGKIRAISADPAGGDAGCSLSAATAQTQSPAYMRLAAGDIARQPPVYLGIDKSVVIDLPRPAGDVLVSNPQIADAVLRTSTRLYLIGVKLGQASVFLFDNSGAQIASFDIYVEADLGSLNQLLAEAIPNGYVRAEAIQGSIVLRGTVPSSSDAQRAVQIANSMIAAQPLSTSNTASTGTAAQASTSGSTSTLSRPIPAPASSTSSPSPARSRWR